MAVPSPPTLASALADVSQLLERQGLLAKSGPSPGSAAFRAGRTALGRHAWDLSVASLAVAADHLIALHRLVLGAGHNPVWAAYTVMRSALETACLARWLSQPGILPSDRLARGVAAQIADYEERAKVERLAPQPPNVTAKQRIANLRAAHIRLHYGPLPDVPGPTRLVAAFALPTSDAELLYRVLSAAAHGKQWAMLPMGEWAATAVTGPRRSSHVAQLAGNESMAAMMAELVAGATSRALRDVETYGGRVGRSAGP